MKKKISELSTCNSNDHIIYGGNAVFASDDTATEETADEKKEDAADDTEKPDVDLSDKKSLAFVFISSLITS